MSPKRHRISITTLTVFVVAHGVFIVNSHYPKFGVGLPLASLYTFMWPCYLAFWFRHCLIASVVASKCIWQGPLWAWDGFLLEFLVEPLCFLQLLYCMCKLNFLLRNFHSLVILIQYCQYPSKTALCSGWSISVTSITLLFLSISFFLFGCHHWQS